MVQPLKLSHTHTHIRRCGDAVPSSRCIVHYLFHGASHCLYQNFIRFRHRFDACHQVKFGRYRNHTAPLTIYMPTLLRSVSAYTLYVRHPPSLAPQVIADPDFNCQRLLCDRRVGIVTGSHLVFYGCVCRREMERIFVANNCNEHPA